MRIDNEVHYLPLNAEFKQISEVFTERILFTATTPASFPFSAQPRSIRSFSQPVLWCGWIMVVDCVWVVGALENCERTRKYTFPNFSIILKSKLNPHSFIWWHRGTDNPVVHSLLLVFNHHLFSSHPRVCRWNK